MEKLIFIGVILCMCCPCADAYKSPYNWGDRYHGKFIGSTIYCDPKPYVPGGGIKTIQKIKAPKATLEENEILSGFSAGTQATGFIAGLTGFIGEGSSKIKNVQKVFNTASKMASTMWFVSGILSYLGGEPSAQDILDATNKAFEEFAEDVNNRMSEMKGYVDGKIIESRAIMLKREYQTLMPKWSACLHHYHEETEVNQCQKRAYLAIRSERAKFMIFKNQLQKGTVSREQLKELEMQFPAFRDYSFLTLLVLRSVRDSFKNERGEWDEYIAYLKKSITVSQELIKYAHEVNNAILNFYGAQSKNLCKKTMHCKEMKETKKAKDFWSDKKVVDRSRACECRMFADALPHELCEYQAHNRPNGQWHDFKKWLGINAKDMLYRHEDIYWKQTLLLVQKYWQETVMSQVQLWEQFAVDTQKELLSIAGPPNLALGRPTSQSGQNSGSNLAVDGKHDKCFPQDHQSTNTGLQQNPSWTVTLDKAYDVRYIILYVGNYNPYAHANSLSHTDIYVYDKNNKPHFCANTGDMSVSRKMIRVTCNFGAIGNKVKLEKQVHGQLNLCEVMVYGQKVKSYGRNLALNGLTRQSSTLSNFPSSKAVDGNKANCSSNTACSSTMVSQSPYGKIWWQVQLPTSYYVENVLIYGCGDSSLSQFDITVINSDGKISLCRHVYDLAREFPFNNVKCGEKAYGEVVRIDMKYLDQPLRLCEVEVYGRQFDVQNRENLALHGKTNASSSRLSSLAVDGDNLNCDMKVKNLPVLNSVHPVFISDGYRRHPGPVYEKGRGYPGPVIEKGQIPSTRMPPRPGMQIPGISSIDFSRDPKSFWQVQLISIAKIESVIIYNRVDCCTNDLSNVKITVLSSIASGSKDGKPWEVPFGDTGIMNAVIAKEIKTTKDVFGDIVRLDQTRPHVSIALCEVEVYGRRATKMELYTSRMRALCEKKKEENINDYHNFAMKHLCQTVMKGSNFFHRFLKF
ncbi:uncharacterized protein [Clytia hemisphaerica]|uniref:Fucolectin tachylectin-4 pentraxin-1 domain-containing protein n=1 Tax=Clytia hemisphaerica TaxID=252671 RepID=A0A7M5X9W0_9CNID